jgi:hypothetical protein
MLVTLRSGRQVIGAVVALLTSAGFVRGENAVAAPPPFALVSAETVARLRSHADSSSARSLIRQASEGLKAAPHPLPVLHTEGTLPHAGIRDESEAAEKDWPIMIALAFAARLTEEPRYVAASERYFSAWLSTYKISFHPIDETHLDQMLLAYDLVGAELSPATQKQMAGFSRTLAEGYIASIAHAQTDDISNWQSHRIKLLTQAAYQTGDPKLIDEARRLFEYQVAHNIKRDGSVVDFYQRDALHYVVYDLEPLIIAALAAKAHGADWFHPAKPKQTSVMAAVDWLTPFALGEKTHEEFVHSTVKFDASRARAGQKGYAGIWSPDSSLHLYEMAALLDPKYRPIHEHVAASTTGGHPLSWLTLLNDAGFLPPSP